MPRYIADVRFIASIYPGQLPELRRHYGPSMHATGVGAQRSTLFRLEPVKKGGRPFILPVYDSFEEILNPMARPDQSGRKPRLTRPEEVANIVADLLKEWTANLYGVPEGAKPGVMEVHLDTLTPQQMQDLQNKGIAPKTPTSGIPGDEYAQMVDQQTRYFEYWFMIGEQLHSRDPKVVQQYGQITNTMRLAADWLGHQRPWTNRDYILENVPCPWCTALIPQSAIVCPTCGRQVKETPKELAGLVGTK